MNCLPHGVNAHPSVPPSLRNMDEEFICIHYVFRFQEKGLGEDKTVDC